MYDVPPSNRECWIEHISVVSFLAMEACVEHMRIILGTYAGMQV
jgi:hypothetical protein